MKKREDFAVSLRKKKTQDLISAKRRKLMNTEVDQNNQSSNEEAKMNSTMYNGYS